MTIFDSNFKLELEKIAKSIFKTAQVSPVLNLAKTLMADLESEIKSSDEKFSIPTGKETSPVLKDLNSLDNLIGFLAGNQVRFNDKYIAQGDPSDITKPYDLDKQGLKEYLIKLRSDAIISKNSLFVLLVGKLILQANKKYGFGIPELDMKSKLDEEKTNIDNFQLDVLPKTLELKNPFAFSNDKPLLAKDLSSPKSFADWIRGTTSGAGPEMQIIGREDKTPRDVELKDMCEILNVLWVRAKMPQKGDIGLEGVDLKKLYSDKLSALAPSYSCKLMGVSGAEIGEDKPTDKDKADLKKFTDTLNLSLPLGDAGPDALDLRRIKKFVDFIKQNIVPQIPNVKELKDMEDYIDDFTKWTNDALQNISFAGKYETVYPWSFSNQNENHDRLFTAFGSTTEAITGTNALSRIIYDIGEILRVLYKSELGKAIKDKLDYQYNTLARNYFAQLNKLKTNFINAPKT